MSHPIESPTVGEIPQTQIILRDRPFFDARRMGSLTDEYVAWADVMGSNSIMQRSTDVAANFLMKLHVASLHAQQVVASPRLELYPMIDGVYACSPQQGPTLAFLKETFLRLASGFIQEAEPLYRFTVRCGLAFGPILKGRDTTQCSNILGPNQDYCSRVLLGMPLSQSWESEKKTSPFGIYIHESARAFAPSGSHTLSGTHWKWWKFGTQPVDEATRAALKQSLETHYDWCERHATTLLYIPEDIRRHRNLSREYFENE